MKTGAVTAVVRQTCDVEAVAGFYRALFGWIAQPAGTMALCLLNGQVAAGIEPAADGVERWIPCVAVDDVERSVIAAASLGGRQLDLSARAGAPATTALIEDPEGAVFALRDRSAAGTVQLADVPGAVTWVETLALLPAAAQRFYGGLFGWTFTERPLPPHSRYIVCHKGGTQVSGILPIGQDWGVGPRWQVIFQVEDLDASTAGAIAAGGRVDFGPLRVDNVGRLTSLRDSLGALFVIMQPDARQPGA